MTTPRVSWYGLAMSQKPQLRSTNVTKALTAHARGLRTHLPVIQPDDVVAIVVAAHNSVDVFTERRAETVANEGSSIACSSGCSACCAIAVMVPEPEALLVARWLSTDANLAAREHFLAAYPSWYEAIGKDAERIRTLHALGRTQDAERVYFKLRERRVMCAFNRDGACTVYPVRPSVCRNVHALDSSDHCQPGAEHGPTVMAFEPMDRLLDQVLQLMALAQDAMHRDAGGAPDVLCNGVARLLIAPPQPTLEPARNAPCPCGSGEKFKRCCDF